jgi:hypothetical protein
MSAGRRAKALQNDSRQINGLSESVQVLPLSVKHNRFDLLLDAGPPLGRSEGARKPRAPYRVGWEPPRAGWRVIPIGVPALESARSLYSAPSAGDAEQDGLVGEACVRG